MADTTEPTAPGRVLCLDTSVLVKYLTREEGWPLAQQLVLRAIDGDVPLVGPGWLWAETGSVLRKKIRTALVSADDANTAWMRFRLLPIDFVENDALRQRAWEIADHFNLPTLYDAAFLACTELAPALDGAQREFWTADAHLLRQLGAEKLAYVHDLGELAAVNPGIGPGQGEAGV